VSANGKKYHRRSIRLPEYDYGQEGAYYVTICAQDRKCIFGQIKNGRMQLNEWGSMVHSFWERLPEHYCGLVLDSFVIMPNHVHFIIIIANDVVPRGRGEVTSPLGDGDNNLVMGEVTSPLRDSAKHTLGQVLAFYKYQTTKAINLANSTPGRKIWQRNYFEHIIRNERSYNEIRKYIIENPRYWAADDENPERKS